MGIDLIPGIPVHTRPVVKIGVSEEVLIDLHGTQRQVLATQDHAELSTFLKKQIETLRAATPMMERTSCPHCGVDCELSQVIRIGAIEYCPLCSPPDA